jgi:predicted permease
MRLWRQIQSGLRNLFRKSQVENQLDSELRAYVDMIAAERVAAGMPVDEARRTALADFGGIEQVKQAVRDRRAGAGVERLWQDLRYGLRQFLRNPGFTCTVIFTLALSIGANTAIFSIVNALMLKSLPYPQPERMGTIFMRAENGGPASFEGLHSIDGEQWELLRDNAPSLISAVCSSISSGVNLQAGAAVQYVHAARISAHYLDVLGLHPMLGRNISEAEDRVNGPKAVILSYDLWRTTFGADPGLAGRAIQLKGESYTVVGVLPAGSRTPLNADLYTPLQPNRKGEGVGTNYGVIVRLRDGANWQQADGEINRAWANRAQRFATEFQSGARVDFYTVPLQKGSTAQLRPQVLTLMLAAASILLIACANLAGLTLVRMARRSPEIAARLALGASRWQVQRQLWVENLALACGGGVTGIGVGFLALKGLLSLLPKNYLPVAGVPLDTRVLMFTVIVSVLTSILFGMLPALVVRRVDLHFSMATRAVASGDKLRLRQTLIAGEVALTVVLLAGSGLLIRSLIHLETLPPGFNPQGVMTAKASLDDARYRDAGASDQLYRESVAAMQRIPGVESAAAGLSIPYERSLNDGLTLQDGPNAGQPAITGFAYVTPGYFETLEIPLRAGRTFVNADRRGTQPVAVVNRTFAREFFGTEDVVGRAAEKEGTRIVGVVDDVVVSPHSKNINDPLGTEAMMYIPAAQVDPRMIAVVHVWFQPSWIVRTAGPVEGLPAQMQHALASVDPGLPFSGFYGMRDLQAETLATQRVEVALLSAMAGLALLLSAVGIFALVASLVAQRTREIGIRIALGSTIRQAMVHVSGAGLRASSIGLLLGLLLSVGALRVMRGVVYGVGVYDAPSILAVVATLSLITLLAATVPTLRIARIDPATTLRDE